MKRLLTASIISLAAIGIFFAVAPNVKAQSDNLPKETQASIRNNCTGIKSILARLEVSDKLLRVNRGQVYESMAKKMMERFNARLGSNSLDNRAMLTVTADYRSVLDSFRANYINYNSKLNEAIRVDCINDPVRFAHTIADARTFRAQVHQDVVKLHRAIDDYRTAVGDFLLNYERISR